tara:strand:- start:311 stop:550 length:240 start_codon:yes stop_codon:yes gene_type:complete
MIGIITFGRIGGYDDNDLQAIAKDFLTHRDVDHIELLFPGDALEIEFNTTDEYFAMSLLEELADELFDIGVDVEDLYIK